MTKGHSKNRLLALLHTFGFVTSKDVYVGEDEFAKQQAEEAMKKHVKLVGQVLKNGSDYSTSTDLNQAAKRVLRIISTCSLMGLIDGQSESCPSSVVEGEICLSPAKALGQSGDNWLLLLVNIMLTVLCVVLGCGLLWMRRQLLQRERQLGNGLQQDGAAGLRDDLQHGGAAEVLEDEDEVEAEETVSQQRRRYLNCEMTEVSDPEMWQAVNHGNGSDTDSDDSMMTDRPYDPYAATVLEAIHRGDDEISNLTICNWLLGRCMRRLNDSRDHESRLFYTDAVHSLRDSFMLMCTGERDVPHGRLREMLREFARLSPRDNSPTSHLTVQQVFDELLETQRLHEARQQGAHQRGPAAHDGLDADGDEPMPAAGGQLVFEGPQTLEEAVNADIESIRGTRMRMLNELHEQIAVAEAHSDQGLVWQLKEQLEWWINAI